MKKKNIILLFVYFLFLFGMIGLFINNILIAQKSTNNTTEYIATVNNVSFLTEKNKTTIEIYTNEFSTKLYISESLCTNSTILALKAVNKGDAIYFRIDNDATPLFDSEIKFCNIVSLKTTENEIISLSDYNSLMQKSTLPAKIASLCLASCFLFCIINKFIKEKLNKTKKNQSGDGSVIDN